MTNKLEKQFFDTFGIKPRSYLLCTSCWDCIDAQPCEQCYYGKLIKDEYPKITDRILLELLVIMTRYTDIIEGFDSVQELKEFVLKDLMYSLTQQECNIVKQQVQALFKEDTNDKQK